ncbi:alpha/beta-hydrolase [Gymnopus androsaceus JB14]|uniref:Alpha/beta-hydrolase n=1 Tax=Gymnopus androsaceus JB14 TaxID=1447944 RepID=A0A6A4HXF9_9AGAR|nr:alpha/beta-hydrolase [Gymnopus androsaceus JB14]
MNTRVCTLNKQARDSQTFSLPDGRLLGYAEYGPPSGYPLMFFHGFPSSRFEASVLDPIARCRNIRIIAPERPGFGLSTFQPRCRVTDWPADIQSLADHLELTRFAVLGGSGGGPYALACAMPNAVSEWNVVCSPPWEAGRQYMPLMSRAISLTAIYWPGGLVRLMDMLVRMVRWGDLEESESLTIEEQRTRLLRILFEPFAQGAEGCVHEAQLLTQNWGIRYEDDTNAPVEMIRYMAERIPHCVLREYEDDTHFTIIRHLEEIISGVVPKT